MATQKERLEFIVLFRENFPARPADECITAAKALLRHARTHGNLAVQQCNGPSEYLGYHATREACQQWEADRQRSEDACEKRIKEICAAFGLPVTLGGDPRGYTVKIKLPSGKYNTWGGSEEGYGVPQ